MADAGAEYLWLVAHAHRHGAVAYHRRLSGHQLCPWDLSHDALSLQSRLEMLCSALWCVVLPGKNLCCWVIAPASLMGWACKESTGAMAHSWLAQAEQASQAEALKTAH